MTREVLGRQVVVTHQTIAAIETDKCSSSLELAFRIAEMLGKPLFGWER